MRDQPKLSLTHLLACLPNHSFGRLFVRLSAFSNVFYCACTKIQSCLPGPAWYACTRHTAVARLMHPDQALLCEGITEEQSNGLIMHPPWAA